LPCAVKRDRESVTHSSFFTKKSLRERREEREEGEEKGEKRRGEKKRGETRSEEDGKKRKRKSSFLHHTRNKKKLSFRPSECRCVCVFAMSAARKLSFIAVATSGEVKWRRRCARSSVARDGHK